MQGFGERLRQRASELGLSSAEVARRAGLSSVRYGHYVTNYREPDLTTLVRICRVLGLGADRLLGLDHTPGETDKLEGRRADIVALLPLLNARNLELTSALVEALTIATNLGGDGRDLDHIE